MEDLERYRRAESALLSELERVKKGSRFKGERLSASEIRMHTSRITKELEEVRKKLEELELSGS